MTHHRITSFEAGRIIALLGVIAIHSQLFMTVPLINGEPWLGLLINQLSRFAVPLFFILAGYFIAPKLSALPAGTMKQYSLPLLKVWLVWSAIYFLVPFNLQLAWEAGYLAERSGYWQYLLSQPLNTLFEGSLVHLWYIPGLICGLLIMAICCHVKKQSLIMPVAIALYLFGLTAGSYEPLTGIESPLFTRNGPFMSMLMLTIGFMTKQKGWQISVGKATALAIAGMGLHLAEAVYLTSYDIPFNMHDFLIGTPFWAAGLFFILMSHPQFGQSLVKFNISKQVLGIYLIHLLIIIYLMRLLPLLGLTGYANDILRFVLTCIISYGLVALIGKTPLRSVLLR
ncbi:acyltransferase family protein [Photobacterium lutimaris]|uniref:Fucose 4-O-acetylase n=1 Tax=Photobacterium lutimaris TaxID=388278 RepID=A0A2T3J0D7_9GAMM|nr:acyltransferase family protein [Photobacterium lutimaris]PSU34405.1 fucose 4-O-acetylase [Photobacterium lutimaris]TDR76009.1 surface polysaccharide O-acyltransferase-like enzyme [Photobacterium lutimaris]